MSGNKKKNDGGGDGDAHSGASLAQGSEENNDFLKAVGSNTEARHWKKLKPMGTKRFCAGGIWVNKHQFFVLGGEDSNIERHSSCEYYDTNTESWHDFPIDLPFPRSMNGVVMAGDKLYVVGGEDDYARGQSTIFSLDLSGGDLSTISGRNWDMTLPSMSRRRTCHACALHSNYIYVFGGFNRVDKDLDTAERFSLETNTWERLPQMPAKRHLCEAGVIGNKIYIVGGMGEKNKILAETIVFDTSTQEWETSDAQKTEDRDDPKVSPAVSRIKNPRHFFSIVVVRNQYIVAIGGYNHDAFVSKIDRYNNDAFVSKIEILDTKRNAWGFAAIRAKELNARAAVGFREETEEIIVAGGRFQDEPRDEVHIIGFNDLFPTFFQTSELGQMVEGDTPYGKDKLGLEVIAYAFAEYIAFESLVPPFVLGILGKWGRGKSFFFNLILQRLIEIQKTAALNEVRETFAGHIYVVKFNAWTFSKSDIKSSLMYQILKELNEQMHFEMKVGKKALEEGLVSTIEIFRERSEREIEYIKEMGEDNFKLYQEARRDSDKPSLNFLRAINENYVADQDDLTEKKEAIKAQEEKIRRRRQARKAEEEKIRRRRQAKNAVDNISAFLNRFGRKMLYKALEEALSKSEETADDDLLRDIRNIRSDIRYTFRFVNIPPTSWIFGAVMIIITIVLSQIYGNAITTAISAILSILSPIIPVVTSVSQAMKQIDPIITRFEVIGMDIEDLEEGRSDGVDPEELVKLQTLKDEEEGIRRRLIAVKGTSLRSTVANKIKTKMYESKLGMTHTIEQDLKQLSDAMTNNNQQDIFPRGSPRIILFVDDLDRCEPEDVVEVIENLQLLVKTRLFVALLAIDPRYVCSSLEKFHRGVLNQYVPPSAMDFLEKIIQIPFRLPEVQQHSVGKFVDSQCRTPDNETSAAAYLGFLGNFDSDIDSDVQVVQQKVGPSEDNELLNGPSTTKEVNYESSATKEEKDEFLPSKEMYFTPGDKKMMKELFALFRLQPRCMKRVINVYKILQIIWRRDKNVNDPPHFPSGFKVRKATIFLMLMASEESTRDITYKIFGWMESGMLKYHLVASKEERNLAELFQKELKRYDETFNLSFDEEGKSKDGTLMRHIETYLADYKWKDFNGWNCISSQFLLARSFSFFRITHDENETNSKKLGGYVRND